MLNSFVLKVSFVIVVDMVDLQNQANSFQCKEVDRTSSIHKVRKTFI